MSTRSLRLLLPLVVLLFLGCVPAFGQCPAWQPGFAGPGADSSVRAFAYFDAGDGHGSRLYAAGDFTALGASAANHVGVWNGASWEDVGGGVAGTNLAEVLALAVYDDGAGPALYAAGSFQSAGGVPAANIARWNGSSWSALGTGWPGRVNALAVFDDGSGPTLYVGGRIAQSGTTFVGCIARWKNGNWSALGQGLEFLDDPYPTPEVFALATFASSSGTRLYVGGEFDHAGGVLAQGLAAFDGSIWSGPGNTADGSFNIGAVYALTLFDDGSGSQLCAGGRFTSIGGVTVDALARFDGASWSSIVTISGGSVTCVQGFESADGIGRCLWIGGNFTSVAGANGNIARWDGTNWSVWGTGSPGSLSPTDTDWRVSAFASWADGSAPGRVLLAGGAFELVNGTEAWNLARFDGAQWSPTVTGMGLDGIVSALVEFDDGTGPALYAGGTFHRADGVRANNIARWDGHHWSALGVGDSNGLWSTSTYYGGSVADLAVFDDGTGPALYAVGQFGGGELARWNGVAWTHFNLGFQHPRVLAVHDDGTGPALYIAGQPYFPTYDIVAKWTGGTHTTAVGSPLRAFALLSYDDGSGPALYATGQFGYVGYTTSVHVRNIARWRGADWEAVGTGLTDAPYTTGLSLCAYDDGGGRALYVGGTFETAGALTLNNIARWNGSTFSPVGGGFAGGSISTQVKTLREFDGQLVALGNFATAGGAPILNIARWDGSSWSPLGDGVRDMNFYSPGALATFDDGSGAGGQLFVGGGFATAGNSSSLHIGSWRPCGGPITAYCFGDGSGTPCPCGNSGAPGHGCAWSGSAAGGLLEASGRAQVSSDTLVLHGSNMPVSTLVLYYQGTTQTNGGLGVGFGDGLRCAGGSVARLGIRSNQNGASTIGGPGDSTLLSLQGHLSSAGGTRYYGCRFRNSAAFCTPDTFNLTNSLAITWAP